MKISIIYYSQSGNTKKMAESIQKGICSVNNMEAQCFSIDEIDANYLSDSKGVLIGTPTYDASLSGALKLWLESVPSKYDLSGKLAGAFATAAYIHGGADLAIQNILTHLLFCGCLTYSGGRAFGSPVIHMGPVAIDSNLDEFCELFEIYGERFARQVQAIN